MANKLMKISESLAIQEMQFRTTIGYINRDSYNQRQWIIGVAKNAEALTGIH